MRARRGLLLALVAGLVVVPSLPMAGAATESPKPTPSPTPEPSPTASPTPPPTPSPSPSPEPSPAPSPSPSPSAAPSPSPSPEPSPSPTEDCGAAEEGAVTFGDVDRDCDGTLLLAEQGNPTSIRRTLELPPEPSEDVTEDAPLDGGPAATPTAEVEDRFEPTDFVRGSLVEFDTSSEQGGTIREGSLIYSPPAGFTGLDRFTFLYDDGEWIREAEVIVEVVVGEPVDESASPSPSPSPVVDETEDAAQRALAEAPLTTERGERWDPPWLAWLSVIAGLLVVLAVTWWLFLEVRIQDRLRS